MVKKEQFLNCQTITCKNDTANAPFQGVPKGERRNGESPLKGIDTVICQYLLPLLKGCRNGESPLKGIDTIRKLF